MRRVLGSIWVARRNHAENVASSSQEGSGTNVVRPSEDTKVIEVLQEPDFLKPGKARSRTVDDVFVRDGNTFNVGKGRSERRASLEV